MGEPEPEESISAEEMAEINRGIEARRAAREAYDAGFEAGERSGRRQFFELAIDAAFVVLLGVLTLGALKALAEDVNFPL